MTYINPAKYYNRFDASKNYSKLLFLAGNGLQGAELNEIQASLRNDLKNIAGSLIANGTILSGGEVDSITGSSIVMKAAVAYLDGQTTQVVDRAVTITSTGQEIIGIAVQTKLITDLEDPSILEPDPASPNVGSQGAMREQLSSRWCSSTEVTGAESFFPIVTIIDGVIQTVVRQTDDSATLFNKILNAYDGEVRGSALLSGLNIKFNNYDVSSSAIMKVSSGKARVNGNPVTVPSEVTLALDPISDTRSALGEPYTYTGNATYPLRYNTISSIARVQGTKEITRTITHGAFSGAIDVLPDTPVLSVSSVSQGGTTYVVNNDYIVSGDSINWSPAGAEPAPGSTYTVTYRYISTFTPTVSGDLTGVVLDSSNALVSGTVFYVDYSYYLRRIDRISLAPSGQFIVSKGTPGYSTYDTPGYVAGTLSMATVTLQRGVNPTVTRDTVINVDIQDMNIMQSQIADLSASVASLSLLESARSTDPTVTKRNIFVDNLDSTAQQDAGLTNNLGLQLNTLYVDSSYNVLGVTSDNFMLPFTQTPIISQTAITGSRKINPYAAVNNPPLAKLELTPPQIIQSNVVINRVANKKKKGKTVTGTTYTVDTKTAEIISCRFTGFWAAEPIAFSYRGTTQNITADSSGNVTYNLTVPAGTPPGNYEIKGVGQFSTAIASQVLKVSSTTRTDVVYYDPLAETFVTDDDYDLSSVDIYVTELPDDDIVIKIGEANLGIPVSNTISESGRIKKASVVPGWNTVVFNPPVPVAKGTERSLVVITSRPVGSVAVAKVGAKDLFTQKIVTTQPYDGVLQASANESTWTPFQDEDLAFIMRRAQYDITGTTVTLLSLTGLASITDWVLPSDAISIPDRTNIRFYLQDSTGNQYDIIPDQPLYTVPLSGAVTLKAVLTSLTDRKSPIISKGLTLYGGLSVKPGSYTSRQFPIPSGSTTPATLKLVIQEYIPSGSTFQPSVQLANDTFASMTYSSGTAVGDGWYENIYVYTGLASNNSRLRLTLNKTTTSTTPYLRKIRLLIQ